MNAKLLLYILGRGNPELPISQNLAAWYKAEAGITTVTGVSQWNDQSGNARHLAQATTTKQPAYSLAAGPNGLPALTFDGTDDFLAVATFGLAQPATYYLLLKQISWTSGDRIFDGSTVNQGTMLQSNPGSTPDINIASGSNVGPISNLAVGAWGVMAAVFNGASSSVQLNLGTPVTGDSGAANPGGLTLGADGPAAAFTLNSNIAVAEWVVYSAAHNADQRAAVVRYLMKKAAL